MHILFLTDNFPPEVNAPASRTFEHCREWVKEADCDVTEMTCAPNFPTGRVFEGYRNKLFQVEVVEGIRVIHIWSFIASNQRTVKRILDYLSFMVIAIIASCFAHKVNVIVATSPQFFVVCAARENPETFITSSEGIEVILDTGGLSNYLIPPKYFPEFDVGENNGYPEVWLDNSTIASMFRIKR